MDDTQTTNQTLDPSAINLSKAIRQVETGGNANATGKSGEWGAYQFTQPTWESLNKQFGTNYQFGNANIEQQNELAYKKVKQLKDQGYNPAEISSWWNSGDPTAYLSNLKGTNKYGVKYDVPAYVASVQKAYNTIKSGGRVGVDVNNPSSTAGNQVASQPQNNPYGASFQVGNNTGNTGNPVLDIGQGVGTDLLKMAGNIPSSAVNLAKNLGNVALHPIKTAENIGNTLVGAGEKIGSSIPGLPAYGTNPSNTQTKTFDAVANMIKSRYGSVSALRKTAVEDPVGLAMDISTALQTGGSLVKSAGLLGQGEQVANLTEGLSDADKVNMISEGAKSGELGTTAQIGQGMIGAGNAINPVGLALKGLGATSKLAGGGLIKLSDIQNWANARGLNGLSTERIVSAYIANNFGGIPAAVITYLFEPTVVKILNGASTLTGKGLIGTGNLASKVAPSAGMISSGLNVASKVNQ